MPTNFAPVRVTAVAVTSYPDADHGVPLDCFIGHADSELCTGTVMYNGLPLDPRADISGSFEGFDGHGFRWASRGGGARNLARAILAAVVDDDTAVRLTPQFRDEVVSGLFWDFVLPRKKVEEWLRAKGVPHV